MPALAEVPDGNGEWLPSGNIIPNTKTLRQFMNDLHETIVAQLLKNRTCFFEMVDDQRVVFPLPSKEQIQDFVPFHDEEGKAIGVVLMIPSIGPSPGGEPLYHTEVFEYEPPKPPDTSYLPEFSGN